MAQNRSKLLILLASNMANVVVHRILKAATDVPEVSRRYDKEALVSLDTSRNYRQKINPVGLSCSGKDQVSIRKKVMQKARTVLLGRIAQGYKNVDLGLIEQHVDALMQELKI